MPWEDFLAAPSDRGEFSDVDPESSDGEPPPLPPPVEPPVLVVAAAEAAPALEPSADAVPRRGRKRGALVVAPIARRALSEAGILVEEDLFG